MATIAKDSSGFKKLVKSQNLSQCCEDYLLCMADPFSADTGCLPASLVSVPSKKMKVFASGTLSTSSTNGNGFILIRPGLLVCSDNPSANNGGIRYTTSTFTGTTFSNTTGTVGVSAAQTNSEYLSTGAAATASTGFQWRMVSCGIELEATTAWSTRGGLVTGICEPDHATLHNLAETDVAGLDASFRDAVSSGGDSKFQLKYNGPANPSDLDYQTTCNGTEAISQCFMGMFISGPNSQTYMWRVVAHFEIIGYAARGKTVTWPDPHGAGLTQAIISKTHAENGSNHHDSPGFWGTLSSALHEGIKATSSGLDKVANLAKSATKVVENLPGPAMLMKYGVPALEQYAGASSGRVSMPRVAARPSYPAIQPRSVPRIAAKPSVKAIKPKKR